MNADCHEVRGSTKVKCVCHAGYRGNGHTCTGVLNVSSVCC